MKMEDRLQIIGLLQNAESRLNNVAKRIFEDEAYGKYYDVGLGLIASAICGTGHRH